MDERRFDRLARLFGAMGSRRAAAQALGGGAFALGLTWLSGGDAAGKKGKKKGGKGKGKGKTGGCRKTKDCARAPAEQCRKGKCFCTSPAIVHIGYCSVPPDCLSVGSICTANFQCCSDRCDVLSDDGVTLRCNRGELTCLTPFDCESQDCRGFSCKGFRAKFPKTYPDG